MKTKKVITTVGTSFIENANNPDKGGEKKDIYSHNDFSKGKSYFNDWNNTDGSTFQQRLERIKNSLRKYSENCDNIDVSAEIKSLIKIQQAQNCKLEVYLICTDTIRSVIAADMICEWFKGNVDKQLKGHDPEEKNFEIKFQHNKDYVIEHLQVATQKDYEKGFMNLITALDKIADKDTILNITGGYKAIIPIMTLYGQLKEIPLNYIYEDADKTENVKPIEVGNLPFSFDWTFGEIYFDLLTKEGLKTLNTIPDELLEELKENGLIKMVENKYKLTVLGQMFRDYMQPLLSDKKSSFGYFMELILFKTLHEQQSDNLVRQGKKIWWYIDTNTYGDKPKFDKNDKQERSIDIDIFIQENDDETWCEVKPFTRNKINEAKKQIDTMLFFLDKTQYPNVKKIKLILYKLPNVSLEKYKNNLKEIQESFKNKNISISFFYYELQIGNKGLPNTKVIFDNEIILQKIDLN